MPLWGRVIISIFSFAREIISLMWASVFRPGCSFLLMIVVFDPHRPPVAAFPGLRSLAEGGLFHLRSLDRTLTLRRQRRPVDSSP